MRLHPLFEPRDLWIGAYVDTARRRLYVMLLPMLGFYVELDGKRREYKHGAAWAFWAWTDVDWPRGSGEIYLRRLHLLKTPWFSIMLHWIFMPDPAPDPHDHPVGFVSLCLRGGYREELFDDYGELMGTRDQMLRLTRPGQLHRIVDARGIPLITLVITGPKVREWGYQTSGGWVPYKEYREDRGV